MIIHLIHFGLHDKVLNLTINTINTNMVFWCFHFTLRYPCYIVTQRGKYFSTFHFVQAVLTETI